MMTYLTFLLVFILPPIVALAVRLPRPVAGRGGLRARLAIPLVVAIALAYTTPWDNYLVYRGVWWYGADRVLGTIGYVPIEEYLFFALQPLLTGLVLYHALARRRDPVAFEGSAGRTRVVGSIVYFSIAITGFWLVFAAPVNGLYMGLILAWAAPVLALMWAYAGPLFAAYRRPFAQAVAISTVYLWLADRIAIGLGIWDISDTYSFDWDPLGLPIEEAVFFLVTNLLVVQGTLLFLHGDRLPSLFKPPATLHESTLHESSTDT